MKHLVNNATEATDKPWVTLDVDGIHYGKSIIYEGIFTIGGIFFGDEYKGTLEIIGVAPNGKLQALGKYNNVDQIYYLVNNSDFSNINESHGLLKSSTGNMIEDTFMRTK